MAAAAGSVAAGLLNFVIPALRGTFSGEFEDFNPVLDAGQALNTGGDPYRSFVPHAHDSLVTALHFDYPPLVAVLARPLAAMPHEVSRSLWLLTLVVASVTASVLVARALLPALWPRTAIALCASMLYLASTYNFWHGNINSLVVLLVALALRDWLAGREIRCGVWLALGAGLKLAPIVLLVLFVRRRWYRGIASAGLVLVAELTAGLLAGAGPTRTWITQVLPVLSRDDGWIYNQSWNAVVNRLFNHDVLALDPALPGVHLLVLGMGVAALLAVGWVVRPGEQPRERRGLEFGAGVTAMLLGGTITWYAHYAHLIVPLAAAAGFVSVRGWRSSRLLTFALVLTVVVVAVVAPPLITARDMPALVSLSHTGAWWAYLQLVSLPAICVTALLIAQVRALREGGTAPVRNPVISARRVGTPAQG